MRARERRFIGGGNAWVDQDARKLRGWQIKCSSCGELSKVVASHGTSVPPEMIARRLERQGWFVDARDGANDLCPACYSSPRSMRSARPAASSLFVPKPSAPPAPPPQRNVLETFPPRDALKDAFDELIKDIHRRRQELSWKPLLLIWGRSRIDDLLREFLTAFCGDSHADGLMVRKGGAHDLLRMRAPAHARAAAQRDCFFGNPPPARKRRSGRYTLGKRTRELASGASEMGQQETPALQKTNTGETQ
jgi:hypothetical protein